MEAVKKHEREGDDNKHTKQLYCLHGQLFCVNNQRRGCTEPSKTKPDSTENMQSAELLGGRGWTLKKADELTVYICKIVNKGPLITQ